MHSPAELKDQSREFSVEELFFSITDPRGVITAWNDVFVRISAYAPGELQGSPHNIIRHPHMPRGVFQMLWEAIQAGRVFSGYVKNRAKDGAFYWVYTVVAPIAEGYLSIRFKPTGPLLAAAVEGLYRDALAHEASVKAGGASTADTARAGAAFIRQKIAALGFTSYDTFSQHAFAEEMRHRDEALKRAGRAEPPMRLDSGTGPQARELADLYPVARQASLALRSLFGKLDVFSSLSGELRKKAESVLKTTEDFHLNAMNANIAAQRLGAQAVSLGTVATFLGHYGQILAREIGELDRQITLTTDATEAATSSIATARLQIEMILFFMTELGRIDGTLARDGAEHLRQLPRLERAFAATLRQTREAIRALQVRVPEIRIHNETLLTTVLRLEMTQVSGLTESARVLEGTDLRDMFASFRAEIAGVRTDLENLGNSTEELGRLVDSTPAALVQIVDATAPLKHRLATLAGGEAVAAAAD
ncbi:MAG: PAS domain-containing protein [Opitutaceae bacterium]|nr:PAS domain-containing protein [Opitutaceae bacterium]